jgi:hypothetical protein
MISTSICGRGRLWLRMQPGALPSSAAILAMPNIVPPLVSGRAVADYLAALRKAVSGIG